jgi:hypothetical protein
LAELENKKDELNKLKTYNKVTEKIEFYMKCMMYLVEPDPKVTKKNEKTHKNEIDWW